MFKILLFTFLLFYQYISIHLSGISVSGEESQRSALIEDFDEDHDKSKPTRIAIIGAGIGGASSAYFLNDLIKNNHKNYEIHIFEKDNRIGGRLHVVEIDGNFYESGGSIIHERNQYASYFAKKFSLKRRQNSVQGQKNCIINGTEMVFCETDNEFIDIMKGAWRYGFDFLTMKTQVKSILDHFDRIYQIQKQGISFNNVQDLIYSMNPDFVNYTKQHYSSLIRNQGYRNEFINEILQSITLVNYGQSVAIPAFVGFVSFAGAGSDLWSIQGGNKRLAEKFLEASNAVVHKKTTVSSITALSGSKFKIGIKEKDANFDTVFDVVIMAFPWTVDSNIELINIVSNNKMSSKNYRMHLTRASFIKGVLFPKNENYAFFSCNENNFATSISEILPVDKTNESESFSKKSRIFKVFSSKNSNFDDLKKMFLEVQPITSIDWLAYPEYSMDYSLPSFKLADGLFYLNAIEWAASAMEMSMIGAKNVALLACEKLKVCDKTVTFNTPRTDL